MNLRPALLPLLAASAALLSACVVAPYPSRGVVYAPAPVQQLPPPIYSPAPNPGYVIAPSAPPPVYQEVVPVRPFADAIWIAGFWGWLGGRYVWNGGHWDHPRPGHRWEPHRWVPHSNGGWRMEGGNWRNH